MIRSRFSKYLKRFRAFRLLVANIPELFIINFKKSDFPELF